MFAQTSKFSALAVVFFALNGNCEDAKTTCLDVKDTACHLALGNRYAGLEMWFEAQTECSIALASPDTADDAEDCVREAKTQLEAARSMHVKVRAQTIKDLSDAKSFDLARKELDDLQKVRADPTGKLGPLREADEQEIAGAESALAKALELDWPRNIPKRWELRAGTPRVVSWAVTGIEVGFISLVVYFVAVFARFLFRKGKYSELGGTIEWTVSQIVDDTKQAAAGALMDALNVYYNPLFQELPVSSLLAVPIRLLDHSDKGVEGEGEENPGLTDAEISVWRDFLLPTGEVPRRFLSAHLEDIETAKFARHRFKQVRAFDDFNLKLGGIEATPGAIVRGLRRWWQEGWPSVSGAVTIETINAVSFANVRLIGSSGSLQRASNPAIPVVAQRNRDITVEELFSSERTITVFASTQIDQYTDAVALASHRAAFRLLFRLVRPNEANLAIAASSYRQGVRLLTTAL